MAYAIYRCKKIKTMPKLKQTSNHNARKHKPEHADKYGEAHLLYGSDSPESDAKALIPAKHRKDAVIAMELLLTASPEYFRPSKDAVGFYDPDLMEAWRDKAMTWLHAEFGDRLVNAILHLDESTPHIQALVVPLDPDTGRLNAKKQFGPKELTRQQDTYAEAMAPLGLERGMRGFEAKHEKLRDYYKRVNAQIPDRPELRLPELPAPPTLRERIKSKLGYLTDYDDRVEQFKVEQKQALIQTKDVLRTLTFKARELENSSSVQGKQKALDSLTEQIRELRDQDPVLFETATSSLDQEGLKL